MKKYLYIDADNEDWCGDLYVSLKPLDADESEYREVTMIDIEQDCFMGRYKDAKVKIAISEQISSLDKKIK